VRRFDEYFKRFRWHDQSRVLEETLQAELKSKTSELGCHRSASFVDGMVTGLQQVDGSFLEVAVNQLVMVGRRHCRCCSDSRVCIRVAVTLLSFWPRAEPRGVAELVRVRLLPHRRLGQAAL
jgi:hypothetical protein